MILGPRAATAFHNTAEHALGVEGATLQAHVTPVAASPYNGRMALVPLPQGYLRKG